MSDDFILSITNRAVMVTGMLAGPMLLGALFIGVLVSLFQAVTQINEQTLVFIPKIFIIGAALVICGPWMIEVMTDFTRDLIINIPKIIANQ